MKKIKIVLLKDGETRNIGVYKAGDIKEVSEDQATLMIKRKDAKKAKVVKEAK